MHGVRVWELSLRVLGALRVSWEHEGGWLPRPGRQDDINAPVRTRNRGCLVADSTAARSRCLRAAAVALSSAFSRLASAPSLVNEGNAPGIGGHGLRGGTMWPAEVREVLEATR